MKTSARKPPSMTALQYAVRLLSSRGYSERKLREKLHARGYGHDEIGQAIERLTEKNLLDDRRFADDFVRARTVVRPRGKSALIRDLVSRGVASGVAKSSVSESVSDEDEDELALDLVRRKSAQYSSLEPDVRYRRIYSLLARRGFSSNTIRKALGRKPFPEEDDL